MNILIIRFRQIGDSVLGLGLCTTLKRTFPDAQIHYVLNKGIAPLYQYHPDVDRVITFDKEENASWRAYVKKVWKVVHDTKYDAIIDMRSTPRTLLFSLFSLHTPYRIGRKKWYAHGLLNYLVDTYKEESQASMLERNLWLAEPFEKVADVQYTDEFRLYTTKEEREKYQAYMESMGIDFSKPVMLVGVTTKLEHKCYPEDYMIEVLKAFMEKHPDWQLVFNYAPGKEEENARKIYHSLGCPEQVKIDLQANSLRALMLLCELSSFYFGNEGGARHIAQAMGTPSCAIFSPSAQKSMWLPINDISAVGISCEDVLSPEELGKLSPEECYRKITPELVLKVLEGCLR